jgi:hypothetical protein
MTEDVQDVQTALALRLAENLRDLQQRPSESLRSAVDDLTRSAAASTPNADYAGITIVEDKGHVHTVGATHRYPAVLDEIQDTHGEGPCVAAAWEQHTMHVRDLGTEHRWPRYCRDARAETPIRSILSFQLFANRKAMAALNLYAEQPGAFDERSVEVGLIFATHTAIAWNLLRRDDQFRSALASRDTIGQAKGMLMERFHIDAVHAFELLKRLSQDSNTPLIEIARRLVDVDRRVDG